jgi:hypothetical protein
MYRHLLAGLLLGACAFAHAQPAPADGTWGNVPSAPDDRFTNPKSKLYAGPNGWHDYGEVRGEVAGASGKRYGFKGGLHYMETPQSFVFSTSTQLQLAEVDLGSGKPEPGVYEVGAKAHAARKQAKVSFVDTSGGKLLGWESGAKAGTVTVSRVNGYLYLKARGLQLAPVGMGNTGALRQPLALGFEGALAPE